MTVEIEINNQAVVEARYITWAPAPCRLRFTELPGTGQPQKRVTLRNRAGGTGGQVVFYQTPTSARANQLNVDVPTDGSTANFWMGGRFGSPSTADRDTIVEVVVDGAVVGSVELMVRVRKDATTLNDDERDAFLDAFGQLNNRGQGRFTDFRKMHVSGASAEAHGGPAFLPWHRAYLLDLERELQSFRREVALPYWRFDRPAPQIFTEDFMGASLPTGMVDFSVTNPLSYWQADQVPGVVRLPVDDFDVATGRPPGVYTQAQVLQLSDAYSAFNSQIEAGSPPTWRDAHGQAHVSFVPGSYLASIGTAAKDPLFFLLHANVDRLWAAWQRKYDRFDADDPKAFTGGTRIGHRRDDSMWPWNGVVANPRPTEAPGGALAHSNLVAAPGLTPKVRDMIDYLGSLNPANTLGFAYDDVQ